MFFFLRKKREIQGGFGHFTFLKVFWDLCVARMETQKQKKTYST